MKMKYLKERWRELSKKYDVKEAELKNGMLIHFDNYKIHHYCCIDKIELFFGDNYITDAYLDDVVHLRNVKFDTQGIKKYEGMNVILGYNMDERKYEITGRILSISNITVNILSSENGEHYSIYLPEIDYIKKRD